MMRTAWVARITTSGPNTCPSLSCEPQMLSEPIPSPATTARPSPDRLPPSSATRDDEDHGDDGKGDAGQDERCGHAFEHDPGSDRDDRRDHARDRRYDPHPPDRQRLIEHREADPGGDPTEHAPGEVGLRRRTLPAADRQDDRHEHPDEQRQQHDAEQRRSAGQETPAEIGTAAGERSEQAQDDGRDRRPAELVHATEPAAMQPIAATASAIPTACDRVTRSRRTTVARMTVVTG